MDWPLAAAALACFVLAAWIALKQHRAARCPRHNRLAGAFATVIAVACVLAGLVVMVGVFRSSGVLH